MNVTDLRIAFKMDTGNDALWAKNHDGKDLGWMSTGNLKGYPRSIYGEWLEEKIGKPKYLRDRYFQVTKEIPVSNYFGDHARYRTCGPIFYEEYINWLEGFVLKFKPEIIKHI